MKSVKMFLLLLLLFSTELSYGQSLNSSIEELIQNPGKYTGELVEVTGYVEQYISGTTSTTSYYLLKGDYGAVIRVNTFSGSPKINKQYKVRGVVYIDNSTMDVFISENSRVELEEPTTVTNTPDIKEESDISTRLLIALFIILLIILGYLLYYQYKLKSAPTEAKSKNIKDLSGSSDVSTQKSSADFEERKDLKTVRIVISPKTMKFIPGELEIISDEDRGKSFKIAGYPTAEGSIVTIGRTDLKGERAYAHIRIDDRFRTVSRQQSEIINQNNQVFIKNLSDTNPTQVNGKELAAGTKIEIKSGDIIRMGELELKYKL